MPNRDQPRESPAGASPNRQEALPTLPLSEPPHDQLVAERLRLKSQQIYQVVSLEGREELARPSLSLFMSGVAAGLGMGASVFGFAFMRRAAEPLADPNALAALGYTFGFVIVVLGRLQLFTENTITVILPLLEDRSWKMLGRTARLWTLVFAANLCGTFVFAFFTVHVEMFGPSATEVIVESSQHLLHQDGSVLLRGIPAGFLIAALVWMLPSSEGSEAFVIVGMTYLIGLGGFTHVIAGSAEVFVSILNGDLTLSAGTFHHILPAFAGNIMGGTCLFTLLAYAQVAIELAPSNRQD